MSHPHSTVGWSLICDCGISGLSHPFFGNGARALGIGKISFILNKFGKINIVFIYEVSIVRLIPIVNLTLFLDI